MRLRSATAFGQATGSRALSVLYGWCHSRSISVPLEGVSDRISPCATCSDNRSKEQRRAVGAAAERLIAIMNPFHLLSCTSPQRSRPASFWHSQPESGFFSVPNCIFAVAGDPCIINEDNDCSPGRSPEGMLKAFAIVPLFHQPVMLCDRTGIPFRYMVAQA